MKTGTKFIMSGVMALLTAVLIFLLKNVDIRMVGPWDKSIGLSHINRACFHGFSRSWYNITSYIGLIALAIAGVFALMGLIQLIRRRSILKVDNEILSMGFLYVAVVFIYVLFNKIKINYRPIIIPGTPGPEVSFPSSHTMLTVVIVLSAIMVMKKYITIKPLRYVLNAIGSVMILVMLYGRIASGVHWFTDVLGSVLLSAMLLFLFSGILDIFSEE